MNKRFFPAAGIVAIGLLAGSTSALSATTTSVAIVGPEVLSASELNAGDFVLIRNNCNNGASWLRFNAKPGANGYYVPFVETSPVLEDIAHLLTVKKFANGNTGFTMFIPYFSNMYLSSSPVGFPGIPASGIPTNGEFTLSFSSEGHTLLRTQQRVQYGPGGLVSTYLMADTGGGVGTAPGAIASRNNRIFFSVFKSFARPIQIDFSKQSRGAGSLVYDASLTLLNPNTRAVPSRWRLEFDLPAGSVVDCSSTGWLRLVDRTERGSTAHFIIEANSDWEEIGPRGNKVLNFTITETTPADPTHFILRSK